MCGVWYVCVRVVCAEYWFMPPASDLMNIGHSFQPRFVVGGAHVDTGQIRRRTFDAMRHGAGQFPSAICSLQHQRSTTVTLAK